MTGRSSPGDTPRRRRTSERRSPPSRSSAGRPSRRRAARCRPSRCCCCVASAIEDRRAVLRADVGSLLVELRRIVRDREEDLEQLAVRDARRVVDDLDRLGVTGPAGADDLVVARFLPCRPRSRTSRETTPLHLLERPPARPRSSRRPPPSFLCRTRPTAARRTPGSGTGVFRMRRRPGARQHDGQRAADGDSERPSSEKISATSSKLTMRQDGKVFRP